MSAVSTLARDTRLRLDSVAFAGSVGIQPDPWQIDVLRSDARQMLLACARQTGKSTVSALLAAFEVTRLPDGLVLLISPSQRQSGELFRRTIDLVRRSGLEQIVSESAQRCDLSNGGRLIALPGASTTIRGLSAPRAAIVDEAGFADEELFTAIMPMLATSNGRLVLASSPAGTQGFFAEQWRDGENWQRWRIRADQCPRISPEFLERQRQMMTQQQFDAEYMALFVESQGAVFRADDLARLQVEPVIGWEL